MPTSFTVDPQILDPQPVTKNGQETITGSKTFTQTIRRQSPVIDSTVDTDTQVWNNGIQFLDKNGKTTGWVEHSYGGTREEKHTNEVVTALDARNRDDYQASISIRVPYSGTTGAYALCPPPPDNAVSSEIITASWALKRCVTTFTVQTITGRKYFEFEPARKSTTIDVNTASTTYIPNNGWRFEDKNHNALGYVENAMLAGGNIKTGIHATNKDSYQKEISVVVPFEGTSGAYGIAPTPTIDSNGEVIATTAWCNTKHQVVSALPASPNANIFYYIPE